MVCAVLGEPAAGHTKLTTAPWGSNLLWDQMCKCVEITLVRMFQAHVVFSLLLPLVPFPRSETPGTTSHLRLQRLPEIVCVKQQWN